MDETSSTEKRDVKFFPVPDSASKSNRGGTQAQSAVYRDHLPCQVRGIRASQKDRHLGDIVGLTQPLHRYHFLDEVARLVADRLTHVCLNEPRSNRVDSHVAARQLDGQCPRE